MSKMSKGGCATLRPLDRMVTVYVCISMALETPTLKYHTDIVIAIKSHLDVYKMEPYNHSYEING